MCYLLGKKSRSLQGRQPLVPAWRKEAAAVGLFPSFDREIDLDRPRKTGLPRLWELVSRDLWDNFRAGF